MNSDKEKKIWQHLNCCICLEIVTIPVHSTCCENAKRMQPACMRCVRDYLQLNEHPNKRQNKKQSWCGCGCVINLKIRRKDYFYRHSEELYAIRDIYGKSFCQYDECNIECNTSIELRRHLDGTSKSTDNFDNCQYAVTRCPQCNESGIRKYIEGEHYNKNHLIIKCTTCNECVTGTDDAKIHYENHVKQNEDFLKSFSNINLGN